MNKSLLWLTAALTLMALPVASASAQEERHESPVNLDEATDTERSDAMATPLPEGLTPMKYSSRARDRKATATQALRGVGAALWLSALALDITLHVRANALSTEGEASESDTLRYRRMHRAAGPLAGLSAVFSTSGIAWGTLHNRRILPRPLSIPLALVGVGLIIAGVVMRHGAVSNIGDTDLREPRRVDGALLIGAGLPALTWGICDGLLWQVASNMH